MFLTSGDAGGRGRGGGGSFPLAVRFEVCAAEPTGGGAEAVSSTTNKLLDYHHAKIATSGYQFRYIHYLNAESNCLKFYTFSMAIFGIAFFFVCLLTNGELFRGSLG